jgi:PHP family Zn ribbon phosphoesterase
LVKKGVRDRARELSSGTPVKRPPYLHILPLGEIIRITENASSTTTKKCIATYTQLISAFGNEIAILTTTPVTEIREVDNRIADAIDAFRNNRISLQPGGGGRFGTFTLDPPGYSG